VLHKWANMPRSMTTTQHTGIAVLDHTAFEPKHYVHGAYNPPRTHHLHTSSDTASHTPPAAAKHRVSAACWLLA
jgi:hypothetical protein